MTSYTVEITGEHGLIRLGDLQPTRPASWERARTQFAELATELGVSGITVGAYGSLFEATLREYLPVRRRPVRQGGHR